MAPGRPDKWIRIPSVASTKAGHKRSLSEMEEGKEPAVVTEDKPLDPDLLPEGDPDLEIESLIIPALKDFHTAHVQDAKSKGAENGKSDA